MGRKVCFTNRKKTNIIWLFNHLKRKLKAPDITPKKKIKSLKISIPLFNLHINLKMLREALSTCNCLLKWWCLVNSNPNVVLCYLEGNSTNPRILYTVTIDTHMTYTITAFNNLIINLPRTFNISNTTDVINLLCYLLNMKVCPGNCELKFQKLAKEKVGEFTDKHGRLINFIINNYSIIFHILIRKCNRYSWRLPHCDNPSQRLHNGTPTPINTVSCVHSV